jgi:hypothetical protein
MRLLISILILLSCLETFAQNWAKVSNDKFAQSEEYVLFDSVHNKLIVSGKGINHIGNLNARGVVSWDGIKWDSLAGGINTHSKAFQPFPHGLLLTGISYNGKLLSGGFFTSIGNVNTTALALWDGIKWDSLSKKAFRFDQDVIVLGFLKKGGLIYIHGAFDTIAGQPANGLATWDGINFNPIPLPVNQNFQGVLSLVDFQNEIYITGAFTNNIADILKYNGSSWISTTGGGFSGPYDGAKNLIVYNNELYAGGYIEMANGNPGNNVIKWDGSQWHDVGFGSIGSYMEINKMLVYHNKLWAFGYIPKVAGAFAGNVAVYDGTSWCGLKDTLDNVIGSAAVYNDTIYIGGGFRKANSDSIPYIAKLSDANLFNQCVNVVNVNELSNSKYISIYPNPVLSTLNITDEQNQFQNSSVEIKNALGQTVLAFPFKPEIDVSPLPNGVYFLQIKTEDKKLLNAKFIKQ